MVTWCTAASFLVMSHPMESSQAVASDQQEPPFALYDLGILEEALPSLSLPVRSLKQDDDLFLTPLRTDCDNTL